MPNDHFIVGCEYRALVDHPNALSQFKQSNIFKVTEEGRSPGMILSRYFKYHGDPNSTEWPYTPISFYRYFELVLTTSTSVPVVAFNRFEVGKKYRALVNQPQFITPILQHMVFTVTNERTYPTVLQDRRFQMDITGSRWWNYSTTDFSKEFELSTVQTPTPSQTILFVIARAQCPRCSEQLTKEKDWSEKNNSLVCWRCGTYV